jgi:hypothetical protein
MQHDIPNLAVARVKQVYRPQVFHADMRIDLRGGDVGVAKDGPDGAQIGTAIQRGW